MRAVAIAVLCVILVAPAPPLFAQGDTADEKTIQRIVQEIELVPSLYGRGEGAAKLPKFPAARLGNYAATESDALDQSRKLWAVDKAAYAKANPLRAAIFEAALETESLGKLKLPMTLSLKMVSAKQKAAIVLQGQAAVGTAIFKLEQVLAEFQEAAGLRDKEKSARWKADFDFAHARVQSNLVFLWEYSFTLGQVRADNLPETTKDHDGWKIVSRPKITVTESKAKTLAKERGKLLKKIQDDHPGTPWAHFAERENARELGMAWEPKKK